MHPLIGRSYQCSRIPGIMHLFFSIVATINFWLFTEIITKNRFICFYVCIAFIILSCYTTFGDRNSCVTRMAWRIIIRTVPAVGICLLFFYPHIVV